MLWQRIAECLQVGSFAPVQGGLSRKLALLRESLRPNATEPFASVSQSLYNRPTLQWERQTSLVLRQPSKAVRSLLAENRLYNKRFERRRHSVDSHCRVRSYCSAIRLPQQDEYLDLLRRDERSRILASFHCGDFLYGSAKLISLSATSHRHYVLSLNESSPACIENLAVGFGRETPWKAYELLLRQSSSLALSGLLRETRTSLLLFCDLPPGLNEAAEVSFLGRPAWFSIGPAMLSLSNRIPLLPLINYFDGEANRVVLGRQFEPQRDGSESLRQAASRMTQQLVAFFEDIFVQHPEQWRFLSLLPSYFAKPDMP